MANLTNLAKSSLQIFPDNGYFIKKMVRETLVKKEILISDLSNRLRGTTLASPYTVYWIDPARIEFHTNYKRDSLDWEDLVFDQSKPVAKIQDGDWDIPEHRVSDMRAFRAIHDRIHHGNAWQTTEYYQCAVRQIEGGRELWGCSSRADFDKRCDEIDNLIESIKTHGYLERSADKINPVSPGYGEIIINISRDGLCLFQDGRHRLAIALALGLKQVPVQVLVRHSGWVSFREFLKRMATRDDGGYSPLGTLYQSPLHFDLVDIPSIHSCEDRWDAIKSHIAIPASGVALDIGCNLGFFCHKLEEVGYSSVGVEYLPECAYVAKKIATAENRKFKVLTGDILTLEEFQPHNAPVFDVVLALNIFHHFIKTQDGYEKLRQFMNNVRIGTLFFEAHLPGEAQMQEVFFNPAPDEFAQLLKDWGRFERAVPIYTADDGRTMFKLDQQRISPK
ncbi:MAG: methyltransferase [Methylobacter sp.]|nr:methyltransferase [Methylobacter sp.]